MTRLERIQNVLANKSENIDLKKSQVKHADACFSNIVNKTEAVKSAPQEDNANTLRKTIVGNTYYVMDSHEDVHVKGIFTKTLKERKGNIFHLHDHEYKITSKVGKPIDVYEKEISWKELGQNKSGMTTALMMDTEIQKEWNKMVFDGYKSGEINQHSVGMQYVKVELAADTDDPEYADAKKLWDEVTPKLLNKEEATEKGYYYVVKEAKLSEISGVLIGSNQVTPTLDNEPVSKATHEEPTEEVTQKEQVTNLIDSFNQQFKS